jgi:hypothetical protein
MILNEHSFSKLSRPRDRDYPTRFPILGRAAVMTARLHRLKEEQEREPGWLQGLA